MSIKPLVQQPFACAAVVELMVLDASMGVHAQSPGKVVRISPCVVGSECGQLVLLDGIALICMHHNQVSCPATLRLRDMQSPKKR
jgi:hypothetical protein